MATAEVRQQQTAVTADEISSRIDRLPLLPFHLKVAAILGTGTMFDAFDSLSIGAALAMIIGTFHLDYKSGGALISAAFGGQFVGAILFGYVGEKIGRKRAFVIALLIFGLCSVATALAQSYNAIFWARVIQGVGLGAEVPVAAALFSEFVRGAARGLFILVYESLFTWGLLLAPAVGLGCLKLFGPDLGWRVLFFIGGIPVLVGILAIYKLPDSPRWLASKGRVDEADVIVRRMEDEAKRLNRPLHPAQSVKVTQGSTKFGELFQGIYARRTFVVWTQWFCAYFVSNGFQTWSTTLYKTIGGQTTEVALMLSILTGVCQVGLCYLVAAYIDKHGRIPWFSGAFVIAAVGSATGAVMMGLLGFHDWQTLYICGLIMILGNAVNSLGVYVYTPELYPTRMRAWATATSSSLNRLGSFLAPTIVGFLLAEYANIGIVFGMFTVVSLFGAFVMKTWGIETKQRVLEELSP